MHASYLLAGKGPYLSQIGLDQRDQSNHGIRRTWQTFLSSKFTLSMQDRMHTHYQFACTGLGISQIGLDQRNQGIYGIREACQIYLSTYDLSTQNFVQFPK